MKRCGLYIRVSTDRQAKVEEGSLKNQDHLLSQHVELKNKLGQEPWVVVERYVDEGRSAKDTKNRPAYLRMIEDAKQGRINTILCVALSRISRSTRDLLDMIEFFKQHDVDFICLKEDFDTTTAQGKCFVTIMGALNEFERAQCGERTRAAFLARAERGLWNGSQLYGYDLDAERKGYLKVNEQEAAVVRLAFETYLKVGSVFRVREIINEMGYRTKTYTSRRGQAHLAAPFSRGAMYQMMTNHAYVGQKEVNKYNKGVPDDKLPEEAERYRLADAVWPAIVDEEIFRKTQRLLQQNRETRNNNASPTKHFYLLNGGFLYCHRCGSQMEGRNGHGHKGQRVYFYYFCRNKACRFKLAQAEIERACAGLMGAVSQREDVLPRIVTKLNNRIRAYLPHLSTERKRLETDLHQVNAEAQTVLTRAEGLDGGRIFVQEHLHQLAERRRHLEGGLERLRAESAHLASYEVDEAKVRRMLQDCEAVFGEDMQPFKCKELLKAAIQRIEFSDTICRAGLRLTPCAPESVTVNQPGHVPEAKPGSHSVHPSRWTTSEKGEL